MTDPLTRFSALRRPALMISSARAGLLAYKRSRHLPKALGQTALGDLPAPTAALHALLDREAEFDAQRRARAAGYSCFDHIEVLIALLAEAEALSAARFETAAE